MSLFIHWIVTKKEIIYSSPPSQGDRLYYHLSSLFLRHFFSIILAFLPYCYCFAVAYCIIVVHIKGNFTPQTQAGQGLVYAFGWLSIIAFGGIMVYTANTYADIGDDLFKRLRATWLQRPGYSTMIWSSLTITWLVLIAYRARVYWDTHDPNFEYTTSDSYWFSYISMLTVGLGYVCVHKLSERKGQQQQRVRRRHSLSFRYPLAYYK